MQTNGRWKKWISSDDPIKSNLKKVKIIFICHFISFTSTFLDNSLFEPVLQYIQFQANKWALYNFMKLWYFQISKFS